MYLNRELYKNNMIHILRERSLQQATKVQNLTIPKNL